VIGKRQWLLVEKEQILISYKESILGVINGYNKIQTNNTW